MKHLGRIALALLLFVGVMKPTNVHPLPKITGSSTQVQLSTVAISCKWIQVIAPSGNTNSVFFGDSTTSATVGLPIAPGGGYNTPTCDSCTYVLSGAYVYVSSGDSAYVAYGQ